MIPNRNIKQRVNINPRNNYGDSSIKLYSSHRHRHRQIYTHTHTHEYKYAHERTLPLFAFSSLSQLSNSETDCFVSDKIRVKREWMME